MSGSPPPRRGPTEELYAAADEKAQFSDKDELGARTAAWMVEGIEAERELGAKGPQASTSSPDLPGMYQRLEAAEPEAAPASSRMTMIAIFVGAAVVIGVVIALILAR